MRLGCLPLPKLDVVVVEVDGVCVVRFGRGGLFGFVRDDPVSRLVFRLFEAAEAAEAAKMRSAVATTTNNNH